MRCPTMSSNSVRLMGLSSRRRTTRRSQSSRVVHVCVCVCVCMCVCVCVLLSIARASLHLPYTHMQIPDPEHTQNYTAHHTIHTHNSYIEKQPPSVDKHMYMQARRYNTLQHHHASPRRAHALTRSLASYTRVRFEATEFGDVQPPPHSGRARWWPAPPCRRRDPG